MTHCGIALEHPANAEVIARMSRPTVIKDRPGLIRELERMQERHFSPSIADAIDRLRNNIPDPPRPPSESPDNVNKLGLGTHPDIIDRLWEIGRSLPTDCCWVAYRQPVLAHSVTGIIFGLGFGTLGHALRLPPQTAVDAAAAGASQTFSYRAAAGQKTFSLLEYGPDWWFGSGDLEGKLWALAAYEHFGAM
jgi:hypothetical protein